MFERLKFLKKLTEMPRPKWTDLERTDQITVLCKLRIDKLGA